MTHDFREIRLRNVETGFGSQRPTVNVLPARLDSRNDIQRRTRLGRVFGEAIVRQRLLAHEEA